MKWIVVLLISLVIIFLFDSFKNEPEKIQANFELEEFKFLTFCHCVEYIEFRNADYIKWKSDDWKERNINELKKEFWQITGTNRMNPIFYKSRYDNSIFIKNSISKSSNNAYNFNRLDSLYFEPIVEYYVKEISKSEKLPAFGLGDYNAFFDCFHKVNEIPLQLEYENFKALNNSAKKMK